jgi:CheY-like chemotaxis protein
MVDRLHSRLENLNVIVVEFDRWTRLHVTTALDELGVSVAEASNGVTGLRRALAEAPHVVIVGSQLPELGAFELLSGLRSDPRTRHTAVVGLTNVTDGDAALQLPCTPRELLTSVASALEARRQTVAAAPIRSAIATPVGARPLVDGGSAWGTSRTRNTARSGNVHLSSPSAM